MNSLSIVRRICGERCIIFFIMLAYASTGYAVPYNDTINYESIGQAHLRSLPQGATKLNNQNVENSVDNPYAFYNQQKEENFNPSLHDKRELAFKILRNARMSETGSLTSPVIDTTTWGDLNLLYGSEKHPEIYVGTLIDRTRTEVGRAYLFSLLAKPIDDSDVLTQRQILIRYWVEHNDDALIIDSVLKIMPKGEEQLLLFGKALGIVQAIRQEFFQYSLLGSFNDTLNQTEEFLDVVCAINKAALLPTAALRLVLPIVFMSYGALRLGGVTFEKIPEGQGSIKNLFNKHYAGQIARFTKDQIAIGGAPYKLLFDKCDYAWLQGILALCIGTKLFLTSSEHIQSTKLSMLWGTLLHQKLYLLAQYVRQMRKIHALILARPDVREKLCYFQQLHTFFTSSDRQLQHLLQILESGTFSGPAKIFYREGRVLVAYKLLLEQSIQDYFASAMGSIAEIDASLSSAKLIKEFQDKPVHYSFVQYTKDDVPRIELEGYWNPFVDANIVVPNSLQLGARCGVANAVVTGPNSGGKSTLLKSIALSLILGQSLGIAPATNAVITPFHYIATYMGITDDISDKASLFQAEVDRAVKLEQRISQMPHNQFSFIMFDELFSGTSPAEGSAIAYATAEELGKHPHCTSIIASHFPMLTELEGRTGRHKNYHVAVDDSGDVIKRFYTLEPGIATQHIALKVARERGCTGAILGRSQEIITELTH